MFTREIKFKKILFFVLITFIYTSCNKTVRIVPCDSLKEKNKLVYFKDSLYTGICEKYYNDTILIVSRSYKEGEKEGEWKEYFNNGTLKYIGFCKNNELNGEYLEYNNEGGLIKKGQLKDGFFDGKWEYFDGKGTKTKTEYYKDNQLLISS